MSGANPAPLSPTVKDACRQWATRPAITFDGVTITYAELWQRVQSLAAGYERLGVNRGDRVVCQLRNRPEHVIATAAAWSRGAVHVGADNDLTGPELTRLVERLDAAALVFEPRPEAADPLAPLRPVARARPHTPIIVHGTDPGPYRSLSGLLATEATAEFDPPGDLDPAMIFLTSGTTGEPKAAVEPLAAHWAKIQFFADACQPGGDDVHLLHLPMAHVFGSRLAMLALLRGGRLVLSDRFSPQRTLELVDQERVTVLPAVPTQLQLLRDRYDPDRWSLDSLRWVISAAANLPRHLAEWVYDTLGTRMMFVFGCSEGFTTVTTEADDILAGSVGNTVYRGPAGTAPNGTVRAVDPVEGTPLPAGEVGEIIFGADSPVPYWDQADPAADGWYHTGDLGYLDAGGRVFLVGRRKELINRGGLHVSPAEVETVLMRHPDTVDAAVVGVPDPVLGECVCACVVPRDGCAPTIDEVRSFLSDSLARHKLPDELCVVETIARTEIGKVDRDTMSERVVEGGAPRERARRPSTGSQSAQ